MRTIQSEGLGTCLALSEQEDAGKQRQVSEVKRRTCIIVDRSTCFPSMKRLRKEDKDEDEDEEEEEENDDESKQRIKKNKNVK